MVIPMFHRFAGSLKGYQLSADINRFSRVLNDFDSSSFFLFKLMIDVHPDAGVRKDDENYDSAQFAIKPTKRAKTMSCRFSVDFTY